LGNVGWAAYGIRINKRYGGTPAHGGTLGGTTLDPILCYKTQGFVYLPGVLEPGFLARLKAAFDRAVAKHAETWLATGESATPTFNIPSILDQDDVFVDLVDLSTIFPLLAEILGPDIQLMIATARLFRPANTFVPPWHSDLDGVRGIDPGQTLGFMAKVHYYPEDLTPEQGCLAFIPGSHRYPIGTPRPQIDYHQDSTLVQKIVPKAGDAVLFNPHIFHMCLDNRSPYVRKSLIYTYGHFWMKNYPSAVPHDLDRLATTPQRKQLFGISSNAASSYFSQSLPSRNIKNEVDGFLKSGRKLLSKAKQVYLNKP
jgi:phytanoyl-CoA hydroxylase